MGVIECGIGFIARKFINCRFWFLARRNCKPGHAAAQRCQILSRNQPEPFGLRPAKTGNT